MLGVLMQGDEVQMIAGDMGRCGVVPGKKAPMRRKHALILVPGSTHMTHTHTHMYFGLQLRQMTSNGAVLVYGYFSLAYVPKFSRKDIVEWYNIEVRWMYYSSPRKEHYGNVAVASVALRRATDAADRMFL